jgi:hypothetical protein
MNKAFPLLAVLPALAALAWAAGLRSQVVELRERLARLEAKPKRPTPPDAPPAAAVEELRAELARVEAKVEKSATSKAGSVDLPAAALPEEEIRRVVDARLEEKKAAAGTSSGGGGEDRKMPLHDMAKELQLDPETQRRVGEIANLTKKEIFDVLRTPRADGSDMAGEFVAVFLSGDREKIQPLFQRLFVEKVPGSERTYLLEVAGIQERARERLKGTMGEEVYTRFSHMSVHPENIETGWDPWADYIKEKGLSPSK